MGRLIAAAEAADLPAQARMPLDLLAGQFRDTRERIDAMSARIREVAEADETMCRLQGHEFLNSIRSGDVLQRLKTVLKPSELGALWARKLAGISGELTEQAIRKKFGLDK